MLFSLNDYLCSAATDRGVRGGDVGRRSRLPLTPRMLPDCLQSLRGIAKTWPRIAAVILTAVSLLLGFLVFSLVQGETEVDALCPPLPIESAGSG